MKRFVPRAGVVLCAMAFGACGGGLSAQRVDGLEASGAIPKLDRGPSLEGIDANGNGIRDDIDAFIERNYSTEAQRRAARQFAVNLQKILLVNKADKLALRQVETEGGRAVHCVALRFRDSTGSQQPAAVGQQLESLTANTKDRFKAYLAYSKAMDGAVLSLPEGDTCD